MVSIISSIFYRYGFKIAAQNGVREKGATKWLPCVVAYVNLLRSTRQLWLNLRVTHSHLNGLINRINLQCHAPTIVTPHNNTSHPDISNCIILLHRTTRTRIPKQTRYPTLPLAAVKLPVRHIRIAPLRCIHSSITGTQLVMNTNVYLLRSNTPTPNK